MSLQVQQSSLSYHVGVRESFGMPETVIIVHDINPEFTLSLKLSCGTGSSHFLPYILKSDNKCLVVDVGGECCVRGGDKPLLFQAKLKQILKEVESSHREKFLNDLRKVRENYSGQELAKKLAVFRNRMDDPQLIAPDVIMNMMITYRDVQDYNAMVTLVEQLETLPNSKVGTVNQSGASRILARELYMTRRNGPGDRDKALEVIQKAINMSENAVPDMLCLCGRIYKDKFMESQYKESFDLQPNEYAGINLVTLFVISGKSFRSSATLQRIGLTLNVLIGRKGSLTSLEDYWDVATFFEFNVLTEEYGKAVQAAEYMYQLEPPIWYLKSTLGNIKLISFFRKEDEEVILSREQKRDKEMFEFWMDFFNEAIKNETSDVRFPVLVLEPNKVLMPSYVQVNTEEEDESIRIWHVAPDPDCKKIHEWVFLHSSIKSISHYHRNKKAVFLYVYENSDDFHIFFPSENHKQRFYDSVIEMIEKQETGVIDIEADIQQHTIRYEYEYDEKNNKVLLGRGTYGAVFAARDLDTQVRIAVKEVPERNADSLSTLTVHYTEDDPYYGVQLGDYILQVSQSTEIMAFNYLYREVQPLHEEIALHSRLSHRNIVKYLGSISEDGMFKIFMEQVPGGSLSALLRSKWGPLKGNESTIAFYTRQILRGLKYLHDNKIVHRDIKGDNVLVNTYSGVLKISDFGTSKRLSGINPSAATFAGTLQYMAPEADIWSLGCTVIEMATGKPPFIDLGPEAAMFKVGFYKVHPEFPPTLSPMAQDFLKRCFDPDPDKRAPAADLLEHPFLDEAPQHLSPTKPKHKYDRGLSIGEEKAPFAPGFRSRTGSGTGGHINSAPKKKKKHQKAELKNSEFNRSISDSCCLLTECLVSSSLRWAGHDSTVFCFLLPRLSECLSTEMDLALVLCCFPLQPLGMPRNISGEICERWLQHLNRDAPGQNRKVTKVHIGVLQDQLAKLLEGLKEHIRDPQNCKPIQTVINCLKEQMDFDMMALNELQLAVYLFQEVVGEILRQHHIQPHWMFALDTLLRSASQIAISILTPDLAANIIGDGAQNVGHGQQEEESTSGVSTFDSSNRPPDLSRLDRSDSQRDLLIQIRDLEDENKRLLEKLIESQQMYQELLKATIERNYLQVNLLRSMSATVPGTCASSDSESPTRTIRQSSRVTVDDVPDTVAQPDVTQGAIDSRRSGSPAECVDLEMVEWLQSLSIDQDTIDKVK
ncbi:hypothetical protein LSH36_440g02047 [Paralvinella palmiformis]|uniref:Protein kinase domain-containing protein n=1 Tax=Paralvinella palmiformis TaxID=53620 RepID=A0AAD9MXR3_9ANNE|nr:hypothetical protein LSH36_440g02047 [Paralvinella palmiformis]